MLIIIFTGLAILPALIICFGGLFLRNMMSKRTLSLVMLSGLLVASWELYRFYEVANVHIELRQWMVISNWMALFPLYASLSVVFVCATLIIVLENVKLAKTVQAVLVLTVIVSASLRITQFDGAVSDLKAGQKMLTAELSPEEILKIATKGSVKEKIVLATRADLTIEVIRQLLADPNEIVRFYSLVNPVIGIEDLNFLKTNDQSAEIRKQAAIEIKKRTK